MSSCLVGEHDFSTFTFKPEPGSSTVRTVTSASFYPEGPFIVFRIVGNSFLRRMVRALTGTIIGLALDGGNHNDLVDRLKKKDNQHSCSPAPAEGLFLYKVVYDE
jgi:tRNA pseudouridine38-40 synthase